MEQNHQDPVGTEAKEQPASGTPQEKTEDKVAYDTYRKVLSEKKNRDERLREMEERLKSYEQTEQERKGNFEELISNLKSENSKLKQDITQRDKAYVMSKVHSAITAKAAQAGCIDPSKLMRLIDQEKINSLQIDDNYNVSSQDVDYLVNEAKKENEFLFKKSRVNVADGIPGEKPVVASPKKIADMTDKELEELYKQTYKG